MTTDPEIRTFYAQPGPLTDAGEYRHLLDALPRTIEALCATVQGLVVHAQWAQAYDVVLSETRQQDAQLRGVPAILGRILELDGRPLCERRAPEARLVGVCRHFALLLCAILRHHGVPARARCGFATYFSPGQFVDHWLCEHWDETRNRWVRTDAQIDVLQRSILKLDFDPLDVPADRFLVAGRAWDLCQGGGADPVRFGIFDLRGLWFIRGNLLRDLAALNRMELLPWDGWGLMLDLGQNDQCSPEELELLNRVSALSQAVDQSFVALRELYDREPALRVPAKVTNFQAQREESLEP